MKTLPENWLTNGLIDFEYKKYLLLDYLSGVKSEFTGQRLYPVLSDLITHYRNLQELRKHKQVMYEKFPERISRADFEKLEISYEKLEEDDAVMKEIETILNYASPRFSAVLNQGKEIYEFIESRLEFVPVGITPIYYNDGYLFLESFPGKETRLYQYRLSVFENPHDTYRGIHLQYIDSVTRTLADSYETIKGKLLKKNRALPNPATFAIVAKTPCPFEQSLLPIAKRTLLKYVSNFK